MKLLIIFLIPLILLLTLVSVTTDYHYKGDEELTFDKFVSISGKGIPTNDNTYVEHTEDGTNIYHYDFFSNEDYNLDRTKVSITNNFAVEAVRENGMMLLLSIGGMAGFIFALNHGMISARKIHRLVERINGFLQRRFDKRYPEATSHYICANPPAVPVDNLKGILCVRSWGVDKQGTLTSIVQSTKWDSHELIATKKPGKTDDNGIYAYRLGSSIRMDSKVMGIVELDGKYEYHPDGIIRAEHCRMLCLFTSKPYQRMGRLVSWKYNLPLYYGDTPEIAYLKWLYSEPGQKCLQYNYQLLKEGNHGSSNKT